MNAPIAANPIPWNVSTRPGSQIRPMIRQNDCRSPTCSAAAATGSAIASPTSGTSAQAAITPANPARSSKASPIGLPTANAPYMPMPTSANTRPERCGPMMPKHQASSPTSDRLSPSPSSSRPTMSTP